MQFALVQNERREALPGLSGHCPHCNQPVIAKCGEQRVWHWAHRGKRTCDAWWERETEWHRNWKAHFPKEWQEQGHVAPDGERHIADVKTPRGRVIEFQHSFLKQQERLSREAFYRNMIWVVDGTRRKNDRKRFFDAAWAWRRMASNVFLTRLVKEGVPSEWWGSSVPVCFDFGDSSGAEYSNSITAPSVWCLLPITFRGHAIIVAVGKLNFIGACQRDGEVFNAERLINLLEKALAREQAKKAREEAIQQARAREQAIFLRQWLAHLERQSRLASQIQTKRKPNWKPRRRYTRRF